MATWIPNSTLLELTGWSLRTVQHKAKLREIVSRIGAAKKRNGKSEREFRLDSLPQEFQMKYAESLTSDSGALALVSASSEVREFPRTLTSEQEKKASSRLAIIEPLNNWIDRGTRPEQPLQLKDGRTVCNSDLMARYIAEQHDISRSQIWAWRAGWKSDGLKGLADKERSRKKSQFFEQFPIAKKFVFAKHAEGISIQAIFYSLKREWPKLYNHGSQPPSYTTVRDLINGIPKVILDQTRMVEAKHSKLYAPFLLTDFDKVRVNQFWVADHRIHDFWAYDDCLTFPPTLEAQRLWETAIIDMRSRVIVASVFSLSPSSLTIVSALRQAIENFGLPEIFYIDNGKDFRKVAKGAAGGSGDMVAAQDLPDSAKGVLARLNIRAVLCTPYHPQSKLIEPFFSGQSKRFDTIFGVAYAGNKPANRPDACTDAINTHKAALKALRSGQKLNTPLPAASHAINLYRQWLHEYNHETAHRGLGMDGRAPMQVFSELLANPRRVKNIAEIEELFWDRQKRKVSNCRIQLFNTFYEGKDADAKEALYLANGTEIEVACDPFNIGEALAFDSQRRFLGRLVAQKFIERGVTSQEEVKQHMKFARGTRKKVAELWDTVRAGVPTEMELMSQRALISAERHSPVSAMPALPVSRVKGALAAAAAAPAYPEDIAARFMKNSEGEE